MNFVFGGTATFNFNIDGTVFSSSLVLRLGQGHKSGNNNWWIGNEQCFRADTKDGSGGVVCGPLLFREVPSYFNVFGVAYIKRSFQSFSCLHESGSGSTHDNKVSLESRKSQSFSLSFDPSWYAVTVGQPVAASCLNVQGGILTFTAGRSKSKDTTSLFINGNSANGIIGTMAHGSNLAVASLPNLAGSGTPSELNFALEGNAAFAFEDNYGRVFSGSMVLRVGQGRDLHSLSNNWWLGAPGCYQQRCFNCDKCDCGTTGLVCGELFFQPKTSCPPGCGEHYADHFVVMPKSWMT